MITDIDKIATALYSLQPEGAYSVSYETGIVWHSEEVAQPTDSEIDAEITRLQTEYDSQEYARSRKQEYDKLNQWEMQFDDQQNNTTTWVDAINDIKARFPK